jgi:hypothetical protein
MLTRAGTSLFPILYKHLKGGGEAHQDVWGGHACVIKGIYPAWGHIAEIESLALPLASCESQGK